MTLVQLEYIIAVDTHRSFVMAAESCFVTQPTLSMQIQKLEESLGVRIFDRSTQPVSPTEIGAEIIRQARIVLTESQKIKEIVQDQQTSIEGELRVGVIPTIAPYLLPQVLGGLMRKHPGLKLHIWEYTTEKIVTELKQGLLDCGIISTPLQEKDILERPLMYEPFVAYVAEDSRLLKEKLINPEDLLTEKLWLMNKSHCMRGQVLNICKRKRLVDPDDSLHYNTGSVETLKRMVDINSGNTILPEWSISDFDEDQMARVRYFRSPEPVREISLVTNTNFVKRKAIQMLEREILSIIPPRFEWDKKKEIIAFN